MILSGLLSGEAPAVSFMLVNNEYTEASGYANIRLPAIYFHWVYDEVAGGFAANIPADLSTAVDAGAPAELDILSMKSTARCEEAASLFLLM